MVWAAELGRKTCPESHLGFCHQRKADAVSSEDAATALLRVR